MKRSCFGIWLIVVLTAPLVYSQSETRELLDKLKKKYENLKDATFSFKQTTQFAVTKVQQTTTGTVQTRKKKFRIETGRQLIITDGSTVWRYNSEKHQVLVDAYKDDPKSISPDRLIEHATTDYFYTTLGTEKQGAMEVTIVKLTPKSDVSTIKSIKLWVDEDGLLIRKIELTDSADNTTMYSISAFTGDTGVPESQFTFTPPPGVEVIDLR